jgi:hypothetical protein
MLLKQATLAAVAEGKVTLAFRRWRKPTVRTGGTLTTSVGVLSIDSVEPIGLEDISEADARVAGHSDLRSLHAALSTRPDGTVYRVSFHLAGPDPRIELRARVPRTVEELDQLRSRLARWDAASTSGPWTLSVLQLIDQKPAVRAAALAETVGQETKRFKANVRKLKGLGLTESLEIGYRLSPRGETLLAHLSSES